MKKKLTVVRRELYHYVNGKRVLGARKGLTNYDNLCGDCSGVEGDASDANGCVTYLWGVINGLWGDVSGLRGRCTLVKGWCTGVHGDLDDCELTEVTDIKELVR